MTTININFYAIAALVGDEYDGWTPPSVVEGWIDTLVAGHVLTSPADVFADTRNRSINLTLTGDIDGFLSDDWVYIIPAGTRVSLVVTEPLTSTNHGPYNWAELDPSGDMFSHRLGGVVTVGDAMTNLIELSTDENPAVRRYVAEHPHTPVNVLVTLSTDVDWQVRRYVAQNPNTPVDVLAVLSTDRDEWVRRDVAKNPNTPVDVLAVLSTDSNAQVRDAVVNR